MKKITKKEYKYFDDIKHIDENGIEFWYARELAEVLDYNKWENFAKVIKRAMIACDNSGHNIDDQFPEARKLIEYGNGGKREIIDYRPTPKKSIKQIEKEHMKKLKEKAKQNKLILDE